MFSGDREELLARQEFIELLSQWGREELRGKPDKEESWLPTYKAAKKTAPGEFENGFKALF